MDIQLSTQATHIKLARPSLDTYVYGPLVSSWHFNARHLGWRVGKRQVCSGGLLARLAESHQSQSHEQTLLVEPSFPIWVTQVPNLHSGLSLHQQVSDTQYTLHTGTTRRLPCVGHSP